MRFMISNLVLLEGWRRLWLTFLAGALASLGQAPLGWFPLLFVALPVLVWLLDSAALGKAPRAAAHTMAKVGWMFGFGFFLLTFYWLGAAFLVEAEKFAWAMPLAILVLPAGLALFWGLAAALCAPVWSSSPLRVIWLALSLSAMEWLRGFVLTGLPWGGLGPALASNGITMQALAWVGPDVMALYAILLFALPVFFAPQADDRALGRWLGLMLGLLFALQLGFGAYRLSTENEPSPKAPLVRLVQPNIPQKEKWKFENRSWIFNRLLALTTLDSDNTPLGDVDMVLWPESAIPFYLIEQPGAMAALAQALPDGAELMTGALRRETVSARGQGAGERVYNSIYHLDSGGTILASYDKMHLVPFGEYLPKQSWLESLGLEQLTAQRGGFSTGSKRMLIESELLGKVLPLICYEVAFSSELLAFPSGADVIVNVTNDAWFGATVGPWQHLHLARMRAVETGLPLVRVANTGISAIINGKGEIVGQVDLEKDGLLQVRLPEKTAPGLYARLGTALFITIWLLLASSTLFLSKWALSKQRKIALN